MTISAQGTMVERSTHSVHWWKSPARGPNMRLGMPASPQNRFVSLTPMV